MKTKITILLVAAFTIISTATMAQFTIDGEYRPRTEYRHGLKSLADENQDHALFTSQRTRLNLGYKNDKIITGLSIQDIRVWGNQSQLNSTDGLLSLHQAWAEVLFTENISLKAGRTELVYDDHRILGSVGWAQQARSHDLALLKYKGNINVHLGFAYNQDKEQLTTNYYTIPKNYKAMQFLWLNKKIDKLSVSVLALNNGLQNDTTGGKSQTIYYSQTIGEHLVYKLDKLTLSESFYYQMGLDAGKNDLSAFNLGIDAKYSASKKLSFNLGYEMLSGTSQTDITNKTNNSFTPLYGTNHKFNGFMDYFYVGNHGNTVGLQDIYLKAKYKMEKLSLEAHVHSFMAAADVLDLEKLNETGNFEAMSANLGTEIDLVIGYNVSDNANIKLGYSHMLGTETMEAIKGGDMDEMSNWAWVMLTVKPKFLSK